MIPLRLQLMLILLSLLCLFALISMILKHKLELKYSLLWIMLNLVTLAISVFPGIVESITEWIAIEKPVNTIFLFGILTTLVILFSITVAISTSYTKIKDISQELGIFKNELMNIKKQMSQIQTQKESDEK